MKPETKTLRIKNEKGLDVMKNWGLVTGQGKGYSINPAFLVLGVAAFAVLVARIVSEKKEY